MPEVLLDALLAALVLLVPGVLGLLSGLPLLFASLGPTALLQVRHPNLPPAQPRHVVLGHFGGAAVAMLAVWAFGLAGSPSVFAASHLTVARVAAAAVAIVGATLLEHALHISHPPAASTTLLIALGAFQPTWHDALSIGLGVLLVAAAGEVARRWRSDSRQGRLG